MKHIFMLIAFATLFSMPAHAGQLFPPTNVVDDKCPEDSFLFWQPDGSITCQKGAHLTDGTLCANGMGLVYQDGKFSCEKIIRSTDVPTCDEGEGLKYKDDKFTCVPSGVPSGTLCGLCEIASDCSGGDNGGCNWTCHACNGQSISVRGGCPSGYYKVQWYNAFSCMKN